MGVYGLGQLVWVTYGLVRDHVYPFPSLADVGYLGWSLPAVTALLLFPRSTLRRTSRCASYGGGYPYGAGEELLEDIEGCLVVFPAVER